jgi:hypothetical protein
MHTVTKAEQLIVAESKCLTCCSSDLLSATAELKCERLEK